MRKRRTRQILRMKKPQMKQREQKMMWMPDATKSQRRIRSQQTGKNHLMMHHRLKKQMIAMYLIRMKRQNFLRLPMTCAISVSAGIWCSG